MREAAVPLVLALVASLAMLFLTSIPRHPFPANGALQALFHVTAPATVAGFSVVGMLRLRKVSPRLCFALALVFALIVGLTSEATQLDSPTRVASVSDLGLDVSGAAIGLVIGGMLHQRFWQPGRDQ